MRSAHSQDGATTRFSTHRQRRVSGGRRLRPHRARGRRHSMPLPAGSGWQWAGVIAGKHLGQFTFASADEIPQLAGRCGICEFQRDCGGCRARAYAVNGELWGEDPFCSYQPTGHEVEGTELTWGEEALARLHKIPGIIRDRVKWGVEGYARSRGYAEIDVRVMKEVLEAVGRHGHSGHEPEARGS